MRNHYKNLYDAVESLLYGESSRFNQADFPFAESLYKQKDWSERQARAVQRMLRKYGTAMTEYDIDESSIANTTIEEVKEQPFRAFRKGKKIELHFESKDRNRYFKTLNEIKDIPGRGMHKETKHWFIPLTPLNIKTVRIMGFILEDKLENWFDASQQKDKAKKIINIQDAHELAVKAEMEMLKDFQKEGLLFTEKMNGYALIGDEPGLGKAQSVDTPIVTPDGWNTLGNIKVGDIVYGSDGNPCTVQGVFPQGKKEIFKVTFSDNTSTNCCNEHLWKCMTDNNKRRNQGWQVKQLKDIGKTPTWIPVTKPINFPKKNYVISPYALGALIGDGYLCGTSVSISTPDEDIPARILKENKSICKQGSINKYDNHKRFHLKGLQHKQNKLLNEIRILKLDTKSVNKFIPKKYLNGSIEQRKALLRGLMDTDGHCAVKANGSCSSSYSTYSKQLALDVCSLVRSLGGRGLLNVYDNGKEYRVTVLVEFNPFYCKRKSMDWIKPLHLKPVKYFKTIESIGEKEAVCIMVDSYDHTYITENYIVTHNTIQSLAYLKLHGELRPALIIVPASLKINWSREIEKWIGEKSYIVNGTKDHNYKGENIIIINYDVLHKHVEEINKINIKAVIIDEIHKVKNPNAKRTKALVEICTEKSIESIIGLSGTPILNRPLELWTCVNLLRPDVFRSHYRFKQKYCPTGGGVSNAIELHDLLEEHVMIRRKKKDVMKELPDKQKSVIPFQITNQGEYDRAEQDIISYIHSFKGVEAAERASRAETLARFNQLKQLASIGKMDSVTDWIDSFLESGEKLVVFAIHKKVINVLMEKYKDIAVKIDGAVSNKNRQIAVDRFQNDDQIKLFIGQSISASEGITLTAASNLCIIETAWSPAINEQCSDRIHRIGQENACNIYYMVAEKTIEEELIELMDAKQTIINAILDGEEVADENLLVQLMNKYKNKGEDHE